MASKTHILVDMEEEIDTQKAAEAQLQFQEFSTSNTSDGTAQLDIRSSQTMIFNHSPDTPGSDGEGDDSSNLLGGNKPKQNSSFWTFEYYQQFFDVDTKCVVDRIIWSMIPRPSISYLQHYIKPKPDLYGPFWICITLVFIIGVSGNIAKYLQTAASTQYHWKYDFHTVSYATSAVFCYAWLVPTILWGFLKWCGSDNKLSFLELVCVYGYSLAIYLPVSMLWVIPVTWLQWLLVVIGATLSGSVLLMTIWPAAEGQHRFIVILVLLALHILLAAGIMLSFFHVPQ